MDGFYRDNTRSPSYISGATLGDLVTLVDIVDVDATGQFWQSTLEANPVGFTKFVRQAGYLMIDNAVDFMNIKQLCRMNFHLFAQGGFHPLLVDEFPGEYQRAESDGYQQKLDSTQVRDRPRVIIEPRGKGRQMGATSIQHAMRNAFASVGRR